MEVIVQSEIEDDLASRVWSMPGILERIASHLPRNDIPCSVRLVNRATAALFRSPSHTTIHLSEPCDPDAFRHHWAAPESVRLLSLEQRRKLVCLTAASGNLANLETAVEAAGSTLTNAMLGAAASAGHLDACQWLKERGCPWGYFHYLSAAARGGSRAVCEWVLDGGCPWSDDAVYDAARGGHLGLLEWLLYRRPAMGCKLSAREFLCAAVEVVDLPTFKWLHSEWLPQQPAIRWQQRQLEYDDQAVVLAAAAGSSSPDWRAIVEWLADDLGYPKRPEAIKLACLRPDGLERMLWLRELGFPFFLKLEWILRIGRAGNRAVLRYLDGEARGTARTLTEAIAASAARCGDLELLSSIHGACRLPREVLVAIAADAAAAGDLRLLIWVLEVLEGLGPGPGGATETRGLLAAAAEKGHLEVVRWLLLERREVVPSGGDMEAAVRGGSQAVMELLLERGCPTGDPGQLYGVATAHGDVATLRWLQQRVPYEPTKQLLSAWFWLADPMPVLRWLVEEAGYDCPVELEAAVARAERAGALKPKGVGCRVRVWLEEAKLRRLQA